MRVLHEAIRQLRDVDETILVNADIDEGAEGGDIGDRAFKSMPTLRSLMSSTPSAKVAVLKLGRGSRPGFSSSERMSFTVGRPKRSSTKSFGSSFFSAAESPISARRSRPQAATIFFATP